MPAASQYTEGLLKARMGEAWYTAIDRDGRDRTDGITALEV